MTHDELIWAALIATQIIVASPLIVHLLTHRKITVTISAPAQAVIDELTSATTALATALSNADSKATAQNAEDLAGIKTAADALVAAINTAATPPAP